MVERKPAEVSHPSEFIKDELAARGWSLDDLAVRMGGDFGFNRLILDLYMFVGPNEPGVRMGIDGAAQLALAFDVTSSYFLNLEEMWLKEQAPNV